MICKLGGVHKGSVDVSHSKLVKGRLRYHNMVYSLNKTR